MAPVATETASQPGTVQSKKLDGPAQSTQYPRPLQLTGVLDKYVFEETTPVIGREYPSLPLKDFLTADNADELFREIAIISQ